MSYSGDAAEQVMRISLEGTEAALKLTGEGAKQIAALLYAVLRDQKRTKGKTRLVNLLRSGKELKVYAVKDENLKLFCTEAKKYGILYCVLKEKNASDGLTDIMVRAEDAAKISRIIERFDLATVDMASVRRDIERDSDERPSEQPITESETEALMDELFSYGRNQEEVPENPTGARTRESTLSGPTLDPAEADGTDFYDGRSFAQRDMNESKQNTTAAGLRPSVRQTLTDIKADLKKSTLNKAQPSKTEERTAPPKVSVGAKER